MCDKLFLVACLVIGALLDNSEAVSFITKCKSDDMECAKSSAQAAIPVLAKGIPELDLKPLDPLTYEHLDASTDNLKLILDDVTITGLSGCIAEKIQRDPGNQKMFVKMLCDIKLDGQYELDGTVMLLPVDGKGEIHVALRKLALEVETEIVDKVGEDGKTHWEIKSWKHTFELQDKAELNLKNLFGGNWFLAKAARHVLSSRANAIVTEVCPPIFKAGTAMIVETVNSFFEKVPVEDLVLN